LERAVARMSSVVDGLLSFAKSGAHPIGPERAVVKEVLDGLIPELEPMTKAVHTALVIEPIPGIAVACAPSMLMSVLQNLLANAAKYIVDSAVPIRRITVRALEASGQVRIEVEDTGPGIPPGKEEVIFEPHVRLEGTTQPGTGLGLATAKRIVSAYGGRIGVRSKLGEGSCFWFELPKAAS
jgi:signal transduction histidine kinase